MGLVLVSYPFVGGWVASQLQSSQIATYSQASGSSGREKIVEDARTYDDERQNAPVGGRGDAHYESVLSFKGTDVMSRIVEPSASIDLPVYHGTDAATLERGVGHLFGSDMPVGGVGRNSVLTAHTGLKAARMFDNLTRVEAGDVFYVRTGGWTGAYKVVKTLVVSPEKATTLAQRVSGRDIVTLVTCTPYSVNTHRFLVVGERTTIDENTAPIPVKGKTASALPLVWALIGLVAIIGVCAWKMRLVGGAYD